MDRDEDYQSLSLPEVDPPPRHRLKRLKKSDPKSPKHISIDPTEDPLLFPQVDFARLEALENDTDAFDLIDSVSSEDSLILSQESLSQGNEHQNEVENVEKELDEEVGKSNLVTSSGDNVACDFERETYEMNEKQKEKSAKVRGDESKKATNKRKEEKERKTYLKELHVESQRLLRETRDAAFKPIPVVQKPISSILEKIRKRKLEISKKAMTENGRNILYEEINFARIMSIDAGVPDGDEKIESLTKVVENKIDATSVDESSREASNIAEHEDVSEKAVHGNIPNKTPQGEEPIPAFRKPVDDTQDLFIDSDSNVGPSEQHDENPSSPLEEDLAPLSVSVNLKFDSAPLEESSSDEEDNSEEKFDPHPSPKGDRMKDFVDDEAEEEDDSDNDVNRFNEVEEDEDTDDLEELNNMIATRYEERPKDHERRNELHQKWLEQQDAAGTDSLLEKLKCGPQLKDTLLQDKEPESDEDESTEEAEPQNFARVTTKMAKQMILQLLPDKEDPYVSEGDDDDDAQRKHAHSLRLLIRKEEQGSVLSPAEDRSSREVFGLIKKLNVESENKRKPKASSFFDSVLKVGKNNKSSKSSFIGRHSKHHVSSSHKQGSRMVRSYIFGRDDSNSRSSISVSEDSSDTVSQEIRRTKNVTAKFCSSQTKSNCIQTRKDDTETASRTSLLEVLKRKSSKSQVTYKDSSSVDLTKSIFAFKVPRKQTRIDGRS